MTHLAFFLIKNISQNLAYSYIFFGLKGLAKHQLHVHNKSFLTGIYDHAGCNEYCKDFTVALKIFNVFDKKQMYDSVVTVK